MKIKDLLTFNWTEVSFAQQEYKKIMILVCSTVESADSLLETLKTNAFDFRVIIREPLKTFSFEIDFQTEDILRFDSIFTEENYPSVKWIRLQQITHVTTAYRDDQNKMQLASHFHPIENNLHLN